VIGGLAVATALTLVFLPALYVAWFRVTEPERTAGAPSAVSASEPVLAPRPKCIKPGE
jgi:hypothetical protein